MKTSLKTVEPLCRAIPCQPDMGSVTTMVMDKKRLMKLLGYYVIGDGGVYSSGTNYRFIMNMLDIHLDYIHKIKDIIETFTSCKITGRKNLDADGYNRKPQLRIESKSHPIFTKLRNSIYTYEYKGIPEHFLKMLDYESLAILYMSDGSLFKDTPGSENGKKKGLKNVSYTVTLNLKRLSEGDTLLLKKYLKTKLGLEWNMQKQGKYRYLRLRCKDVDVFMKNIKPYICESFMYKIKS